MPRCRQVMIHRLELTRRRKWTRGSFPRLSPSPTSRSNHRKTTARQASIALNYNIRHGLDIPGFPSIEDCRSATHSASVYEPALRQLAAPSHSRSTRIRIPPIGPTFCEMEVDPAAQEQRRNRHSASRGYSS
jgi:hypothetical protein